MTAIETPTRSTEPRGQHTGLYSQVGPEERLAEIEAWLARQTLELDALASQLAPRCIGPRGLRQIPGRPVPSPEALSFEQETRLAVCVSDLAAKLSVCRRLAASAQRTVEEIGRPGRDGHQR
jgi:hypothetical protein